MNFHSNFLPHGLLFAISLSCFCTGCDSNSGRYPVFGRITFDGTPVDQGAIVFMPLEGDTVKAGGRIVDGSYQIDAEKGPAIGKHKVLLYWEKKTGKSYIDRDSGDEYDQRSEGLPVIYQSENSPLQAEIVRGKNEHNFILSSAK